MRGALITALSSPPEVTDLDDVDGIRIEAVALNPLDVNVGSGRFYGGIRRCRTCPGARPSAGETTAHCRQPRRRRTRSAEGRIPRRARRGPCGAALELPAGTDPALGAVAGVAGIAGWVPVAWKTKVVARS